MLSIKNVLPNFLSTLILATAATFSINAFANDVHVDTLKKLNAEEVAPHDHKAEMPLDESHELKVEDDEVKTKAEEDLKKMPQY